MGYYEFPTRSHRWQKVDSNSINLAIDSNYIISTDGEIANLFLPSVAQPGDFVKIISDSGATWKINQSASQQIVFGDQMSTLGNAGYLLSAMEGNSLELVFLSSDRWIVAASQGVFEIT